MQNAVRFQHEDLGVDIVYFRAFRGLAANIETTEAGNRGTACLQPCVLTEHLYPCLAADEGEAPLLQAANRCLAEDAGRLAPDLAQGELIQQSAVRHACHQTASPFLKCIVSVALQGCSIVEAQPLRLRLQSTCWPCCPAPGLPQCTCRAAGLTKGRRGCCVKSCSLRYCQQWSLPAPQSSCMAYMSTLLAAAATQQT